MEAGARIAIAGGAGFLGSHLARLCVGEGHRVHLLLRPSTDTARVADLLPQVDIHRVDLEDRAALQTGLAEIAPSHIFHVACGTAARHEAADAQDRGMRGATDVLLGLAAAAASLPVPPRAMVRTGSIAEYGDAAPPFAETQREKPLTAYAAALVACSHYAGALAPYLPFPLITARLALVYGPGQHESFLVPSLIEGLATGRSVTLRRPHDRRDLIHVRDAAYALYRLAAAPPPGGSIINIGSGSSIGVADLAERIAAHLAADPALIHRLDHAHPVTHCLACERMHALFGPFPLIPLDAGLDALCAEARQRHRAAA